MNTLFLKKESLGDFLKALEQGYQVYVPSKVATPKGTQRYFKKFSGSTEEIIIGEVRTFEPLKAFFSRARELVAVDFNDDVVQKRNKPYAIVGVKACDLKGFKVQDHVFKDHDYSDPMYTKNREENFIVSADCTCAIATCFCRALGIEPYPQEDFDLNLSVVTNGFVVEIGSVKGKRFVEQHKQLFTWVSDAVVLEKDAQRKKVQAEVDRNLTENQIPHQEKFDGIIEQNYDHPFWNDEAKTCVECGACNTICPTCHCFYLYDQKNEKAMERFRVWDSCLLKDFARVAGGGNTRPKLYMRLRNRFDKKFDYFKKVADVYACTGCGRCISACPAKIDIRKVLKKLVEFKNNG